MTVDLSPSLTTHLSPQCHPMSCASCPFDPHSTAPVMCAIQRTPYSTEGIRMPLITPEDDPRHGMAILIMTRRGEPSTFSASLDAGCPFIGKREIMEKRQVQAAPVGNRTARGRKSVPDTAAGTSRTFCVGWGRSLL